MSPLPSFSAFYAADKEKGMCRMTRIFLTHCGRNSRTLRLSLPPSAPLHSFRQRWKYFLLTVYRDLTQRFLSRRIFAGPVPIRLMKRRAVDSGKPIFERDGFSWNSLVSSLHLHRARGKLRARAFPRGAAHKSGPTMRKQLINHHYQGSCIFSLSL